MGRVVVLLAVGVGLGFGAGWLVFDWPFGGGVSTADVKQAVLRETTGDVSFVRCGRLAHPSNVWDCTAYMSTGPGEVEPVDYRVTATGGQFSVRRGD